MFLLGLLLCRTFDMLRPIPLRYHILYWVTPEPFVASSLTGTTLFCYLLLKYSPSCTSTTIAMMVSNRASDALA